MSSSNNSKLTVCEFFFSWVFPVFARVLFVGEILDKESCPSDEHNRGIIYYPNAANLCRGKNRQRELDVVARSLGQAEAYLTVREVLLLAREQMVCSDASFAVLAGSGLQSLGLTPLPKIYSPCSTWSGGRWALARSQLMVDNTFFCLTIARSTLYFPGKFISMTPMSIDRSPWPGNNNIIRPVRTKNTPKMFLRMRQTSRKPMASFGLLGDIRFSCRKYLSGI